MGLTVSIDVKSQPKGTPMGIKGLAVVPNGGSVEVDDATVAQYELAKGMTVQEVFKTSKSINVSKGSKKEDEGGDKG